MDFRRIQAEIDPRNGPSIRVAEKLGLVREGLLRSSMLVGEEFVDTLIYAKVASA